MKRGPMTCSSSRRLACAVFLASAFIGAAPAQQAAPPPRVEVDRAQLEKRLEAVATLLEKSSAARQVEASGDVRALEKRNRARQIYREAREAFQADDLHKASQLLPGASVQMFEAVRLAAPEQVTEPKLRADFDARMESVKSLLAAYRRISAEKPGAAGGGETIRSIEKLIADAVGLARGNEFARGRAALDQAYLVARAAISSVRSGDTLVRSLHFASVQEEYHYEIDRNDTHQMLIQVLLQQKRDAPAVKGFVEKAKELRARAESTASGGDFRVAIKLLEQSTQELVRAIRGAGIYIPG